VALWLLFHVRRGDAWARIRDRRAIGLSEISLIFQHSLSFDFICRAYGIFNPCFSLERAASPSGLRSSTASLFEESRARPRLAGVAKRRADARRSASEGDGKGPPRSDPGGRSWSCVTSPTRADRAGAPRTGRRAKKRGKLPRPVSASMCGPFILVSSHQPVRGPGFQGEWGAASVPPIRRTPPKGRGCEASPFAPSRQRVLGASAAELCGRGHVDVRVPFPPRAVGASIYGCCWSGQKRPHREAGQPGGP